MLNLKNRKDDEQVPPVRNPAPEPVVEERTKDQASPGSDADDKDTAAKVRGRREAVLACAAVALAVLATFALRAFRLDVSWDVFIDEIFYLRISRSVLESLWVDVNGRPFYLHPPAYFFLEAGYMKLLGTGGDLIDRIYAVRYLGAALAGVSAGALLLAGRRLAGWPAGIATAAIFALDPFSISTNSLNLLDTPMMMWVLLGFTVLFSGLVGEGRRPISHRRSAAAGVLFGLALLTKEMSVFVTLLPLGGCFVLGWALPRARTALVGFVALLTYAPYPATAYAIGDWGTFVSQKFDGISRLAGFLQITGFNQGGGGPSFLDAVVSNLEEFATTYVLLATGAAALCVLLFTDLGKAPERRLLLAWSGSAYVLLGYAAFRGTLEEQFFYYLIVPSILVTVVTTALALGRLRAARAEGRLRVERRRAHFARRWRPVLGITSVVFAAAFVTWSAYVWIGVHTVPDNGYERVAAHVETLPEDSRVAATSETSEFLIEEHGSEYTSVKALRADGIDYVVASSELAFKGYGEPPPEVYRWIENEGRLVYGFTDRNSGLLGVWRLPENTGGTASAGSAVERGDTR